jgi:hypothetical protein
MFFSPPANLPSTTIVNCSPEGSITAIFWNGLRFGGLVNTLAQFDQTSPILSMTGWMTGGVISGFQEFCEGQEICYSNKWQFDFTFRGIWSNGWCSEGSSSMHVATTNPPGLTFGSFTITMFSPEPATMALLSPGIVLGWLSWRSRNQFRV